MLAGVIPVGARSAAMARAGSNPRKESLMSRNRAKIRKFRQFAFAQQAGRCYYCNQPIWLRDPGQYSVQYKLRTGEISLFQCTAEHLLARRDGGGDESANIVAACHFCNRNRHARTKPLCPERYKALVSRRVLVRRWQGARMLTKLGEGPRTPTRR